MIDLEKLDEISKLVHNDITSNVRSKLSDAEEQKTYDDLYEIHTNLIEEYRTKIG